MRCCPTHADIQFDDLDTLIVHMLGHIIDLETATTTLGDIVMGDLTKLTTDITALIAQHDADQAEIASLKSANDGDQSAIDALDATVVAALPVVVPADPATDGSTPIGDSIPA